MSVSPVPAGSLPPQVDALLSRCIAFTEQDDVRFNEPWEAKAFAMVVELSRAGCFTWSEWVDCFSREVAAATDIERRGDTPPSYYLQWLTAAEKLLILKGVTSDAQLRAKRFAIGAVGPQHILPA